MCFSSCFHMNSYDLGPKILPLMYIKQLAIEGVLKLTFPNDFRRHLYLFIYMFFTQCLKMIVKKPNGGVIYFMRVPKKTIFNLGYQIESNASTQRQLTNGHGSSLYYTLRKAWVVSLTTPMLYEGHPCMPLVSNSPCA